MIDIIILITCILCGFACAKYLEKRVRSKGEFYNDLARYIMLLKINVEGRKLEIGKFNEEFSGQCGQLFRNFLVDGKIRCSLNAMQKGNVTNFFDNLSCGSSEELGKHIDYYGVLINADAKQVTESEVAKASIYVKLGILFGMMVGIVLM
ncbi:MAG: hypothetical protein J1F66_04410 [Clostridiales bacterium]|nr:hypothetical protein [Clostridiales bacterium]